MTFVCVWQAYKRRAAAAERDAEAAIADVQRVADERLAAAGKRTEKVPEVGVRARVCGCVWGCGWWCLDTHTHMGGILCPQQLKKKMKEAAEKAKKDRDALSSALERTRYNNYSHLAVIYRHNARPVCANSCSLPPPFHRAESDKQRRLLFSVAGLSAMLVLGLVAVALRTTGAAPS